jgi:hypothetical protein
MKSQYLQLLTENSPLLYHCRRHPSTTHTHKNVSTLQTSIHLYCSTTKLATCHFQPFPILPELPFPFFTSCKYPHHQHPDQRRSKLPHLHPSTTPMQSCKHQASMLIERINGATRSENFQHSDAITYLPTMGRITPASAITKRTLTTTAWPDHSATANSVGFPVLPLNAVRHIAVHRTPVTKDRLYELFDMAMIFVAVSKSSYSLSPAQRFHLDALGFLDPEHEPTACQSPAQNKLFRRIRNSTRCLDHIQSSQYVPFFPPCMRRAHY